MFLYELSSSMSRHKFNHSTANPRCKPQTLFQQALFFANLRCIAQGFRVLFSFLIVMLTIVGPAFYLSSQTSKREFAVVSETFLPIWALARVTEVFQLGTLWGLKVSYGSSQGCDCF